MSQAHKVPVDAIKVVGRFREDFGDIEGLAASIKRYGLLHPIVVDRDLNLIAGERRLRAHKLLGLPEIEVRFLDEIDELTAREIELEENIQRKQFTWQEEVQAKATIHAIKQAKYGRAVQGRQTDGWGLRDTAEALGESIGNVSMDIKLAKALTKYPELAKEKNKTTAYKKLLKLEEAEVLRELARREHELGVALPDVYLGDCVQVMQQFPSGSFHLAILDPPWGIAMNTVSNTARTSGVEYDDSRHQAMELMDAAFREVYRLLADNTHAYVFFGPEHYARVKAALERAGFEVDPVPLIWSKGSPSSPSNGFSYMSSYESIFFCLKGRRQLNGAQINVLTFDRVPQKDRVHTAQKPVALIRELIEQSTQPGERVIDPFAGSGVTAIAARQARRQAVLIEKDEAVFMKMRENLRVSGVDTSDDAPASESAE